MRSAFHVLLTASQVQAVIHVPAKVDFTERPRTQTTTAAQVTDNDFIVSYKGSTNG